MKSIHSLNYNQSATHQLSIYTSLEIRAIFIISISAAAQNFSQWDKTIPFRLFHSLSGVFLKSIFLQKGGYITENISRKKMKKARKPLRRELEYYEEEGVSLYLNGDPSTAKSIAKACQLAEGGVYMRDYTEDETGKIACVSFDFIPVREDASFWSSGLSRSDRPLKETSPYSYKPSGVWIYKENLKCRIM